MTKEELKNKKLEEIEKEVSINMLEAFKEFILDSPEYKRLFRCTQMRDNVLRDSNDPTTNRGTHTIEVGKNARFLCEYLIEKAKGKQNESYQDKDTNKVVISIAEIVGISHDLGHVPMGHTSEKTFEDLIDPNFSHEKYSGIIVDKLFKEFCQIYIENGKEKEIQAFIESGIKDYIIEGVQNHGQYMSYSASKRAREDLPLICGRLADTLSFMPADLSDLCRVNRGDGIEGTILSKDIIMKLFAEGKTTKIGIENTKGVKNSEDLETIKILPVDRTLKAFFDTPEFKQNHPEFSYKEVIGKLTSEEEQYGEIQAQIIKEVAEANIQENGKLKEPIIAISDTLKQLRQAEVELRGRKEEKFFIKLDENGEIAKEYKNVIPSGILEYEKTKFKKSYTGNEETLEKDFNKYLKETVSNKTFHDYKSILYEETDKLRNSCPTLALIYELQDELIYNQILAKSTEVLGNEEEVNKTILKSIFDDYVKKYKNLSEEDREEFEKIFNVFEEYMPISKKDKEGKEIKSADRKIKAYAIYEMQQLTNDDVDITREDKQVIGALLTKGHVKEVEIYIRANKEQREQIKQVILENSKEKIGYTTNKIEDYSDPDKNETVSISRQKIFSKKDWKENVSGMRSEDIEEIKEIGEEQKEEGLDL